MLNFNEILERLSVTDYKIIKSDKNKTLARLRVNGESKILKVLKDPHNLNEIEVYKVLSNLNVKKLAVSEIGDNYILIEDINKMIGYRFANESDLENSSILCSIAKWYKKLHAESKTYFSNNYSVKIESIIDKININNLDMLELKTKYKNTAFWESLRNNLDVIKEVYNKHRCIVYWDFYYQNLAVSDDLKDAFFFDYDCSIIAIPSIDISIVTKNIKNSNKFLEMYGEVDELEKALAQFLLPLLHLIEGYDYADKNDCDVANWVKIIEEELNDSAISNNYFSFLKLYKESL